MCTNPQHILVKYDGPLAAIHGYNRFLDVPCGKCRECLNQRKNELSYRCYKECCRSKNVWFVTLTYDEDTVPLSKSLLRVDRSTGEIDTEFPAELLDRDTVSQSILLDFFQKKKKFYKDPSSEGKPFYFDVPVKVPDGLLPYDYFMRLTPTVNSQDVRYWIKRFRINWLRATGEKVHFKYSCVFEYGCHTARPHAHLLIFNLTYEQLKFLLRDWRTRYGFYTYKKLRAFNRDGSSAYLKVSRYLGKYMTKGKSCECESVIDGFASKSRVLNSCHLGDQLSSDEIAMFRGYDLFGAYDPETLIKSDGTRLTGSELKILLPEIIDRAGVQLTKKIRIKIPKVVLQKAFGYVDCYKKLKKHIIWHMASQFAQDRSTELRNQEERRCYVPGLPAETVRLLNELETRRRSALRDRETAAEASYKFSLSHSKF